MRQLAEAATKLRAEADRLQALADGATINRPDDITVHQAVERLTTLGLSKWELHSTIRFSQPAAFELRFHVSVGSSYYFGDSLAEAVSKCEAEHRPYPPAKEGGAAVDAAEAFVAATAPQPF